MKLLFIDASLGGSRRKACEMEKGSVRVRGKESEKGKRCNTKTWERSRIKKKLHKQRKRVKRKKRRRRRRRRRRRKGEKILN